MLREHDERAAAAALVAYQLSEEIARRQQGGKERFEM